MFSKSSYTVIWNTSFHRIEIIKSSHWVLHLYFKKTWSSQSDVHYLRSRINSNFHLPPPVELAKWQNIPRVMNMPQPPTNLTGGFTFPYQNNQQQNTFSLETAAIMRSVGQHVHHCTWEHRNTSLQKEALKQRPRMLRQSQAFLNFLPSVNPINKVSPTGSVPTDNLFISIMPSQCLCTAITMHPLLLQATYIKPSTGSTFALNSAKIATGPG